MSLRNLLTVHYHPHGLGKTVDNSDDLICGYLTFILGESIQPLEYSLGVLPSRKLLYRFLFVTSNQAKCQRETHLVGLVL